MLLKASEDGSRLWMQHGKTLTAAQYDGYNHREFIPNPKPATEQTPKEAMEVRKPHIYRGKKISKQKPKKGNEKDHFTHEEAEA